MKKAFRRAAVLLITMVTSLGKCTAATRTTKAADDLNKPIPECPAIATCSDTDYYSVCADTLRRKKCSVDWGYECLSKTDNQTCRGNVEQSAECPGVLMDDGKYYLTDFSELDGYKDKFPCSFSMSGGERSKTIGRIAPWNCGSVCKGYIMNPNYVFWNDTSKELLPETSCRRNVTSCGVLSEACIMTGDSSCGDGVFVCQQNVTDGNDSGDGLEWCQGQVVAPAGEERICPDSITVDVDEDHLSKVEEYFAHWGIESASIFGSDYEVKTMYGTCSGKLKYKIPDDFCPPGNVVSSVEELRHYCTGTMIVSSDLSHQCYLDEQIVCQVKIDPDKEVPECPQIASCSVNDYFSVCAHEKKATHYSVEKEQCDLSSGVYSCFDKVANHWCRGAVLKPPYIPPEERESSSGESKSGEKDAAPYPEESAGPKRIPLGTFLLSVLVVGSLGSGLLLFLARRNRCRPVRAGQYVSAIELRDSHSAETTLDIT